MNSIFGIVGDVRGVVVLDNEGKRIIAKYYNSARTQLETNTSQKAFERQLFLKSNKQSGTGHSSRTINSYENDIMNVENYVAVFRCYSDMSVFILGTQDDNELILAQVLDCCHECFDRIFNKQIERKSLINKMSGVILVIDELIDQGIVMNTDSKIILARVQAGKAKSAAELPGRMEAVQA